MKTNYQIASRVFFASLFVSMNATAVATAPVVATNPTGSNVINTGAGVVFNTGTIPTSGGSISIGSGGLITFGVGNSTLTGSLAGSAANTGTISTSGGSLSINTGTISASNGRLSINNGGSISLAGASGVASSTLNGTNTATIVNNTPPILALNINELLSENQLASVSALIRSGLNITLFGSHHRILRDNGIEQDGTGMWATGDAARHNPNNINNSIGELGIYRDVTPSLRLGAGVGINQARQGLPVGGSGKLDANYLILESDYQSISSKWTGSATAYLGANRATISRGYLIGTTPNFSTGDANGSSWALRLRSDWHNIASLGRLAISPYVSYTHGESRLNGYTEMGGTLPITFAAQKQSTDELRTGITLLSKLSEQTDLRFPFELVYRNNGSSTVTAVIATTSFSFSNAGNKQSWVRTGIELDHRITPATLFNTALLVAGQGGDSSWLGTISLKHAF